jgi:hypothetical protein
MGDRGSFRPPSLPSLRNANAMNIKLCFSFPARAILLVNLVTTPARSGADKIPEYVPPDVLSASNIPYPVNTQAAGAVSLLLSLDNNAQIQNTQALRDIPPLTNSVQDAVQLWTFRPAILKGNPASSEISLTVIFNVFNPAGGAAYQSLVLAPAQSTYPDASQFTPPQITLASFAKYPAASTAQGTVVLDVTIGRGANPNKFASLTTSQPSPNRQSMPLRRGDSMRRRLKGSPYRRKSLSPSFSNAT